MTWLTPCLSFIFINYMQFVFKWDLKANSWCRFFRCEARRNIVVSKSAGFWKGNLYHETIWSAYNVVSHSQSTHVLNPFRAPPPWSPNYRRNTHFQNNSEMLISYPLMKLGICKNKEQTNKHCVMIGKNVPADSTTSSLPLGSFVRYVNLRVVHVPGMPGAFSSPPRVGDPGSLTSGCLWSRGVLYIPGVCETRNFTYLVRGPCDMWYAGSFGVKLWSMSMPIDHAPIVNVPVFFLRRMKWRHCQYNST